MGRTLPLLVILILASMSLVGCTAAPTAEWGTGTDEMMITKEGGNVTINSGMNKYSGPHGPYQIMGCDTSAQNRSEGLIEGGEKVTFSGYLGDSVIYETHDNSLQDGRDVGVAGAVAIEMMDFDTAANLEEGMGPKLFIPDWTDPNSPNSKAGAGSNPLEKEGATFFIIGVIPSSENVLDNINAVESLHQAVTITGWVLVDSNASETYVSADVESDCSVSTEKVSGYHVYVTEIKLESGVVSQTGNDDDEWSLGDIDYLGKWGFIFFFMIVGVGGGVGAYIVSNMIILHGAKSTAKTLLGREGFAKAQQMKKDLRRAKKENVSDGDEDDNDFEVRKKPEPEKSKSTEIEDTPALAGFSLDNILASVPSASSDVQVTGGGVTVTDNAAAMSSSVSTSVTSVPVVDTSPVVTGTMGGSVTSAPGTQAEATSHFSASASKSFAASSPASEVTKQPVKRKSVKKRAVSSGPPLREPGPRGGGPPEAKSQPRKSSGPPKRKGPPKRTDTSIASDDFDDFSI
jgi:hypothetical protein